MNTVELNGQKVVIVDASFFQDLVQSNAAAMREDKRKGLVTLKEACEMIGCHPNTFYKMQKERGCKIKKASVNGKYVRESIEREIERRNRL